MSKVDRAVAEAEFERFCEAMALDVDTSGMDEDDKKSLDRNKRLFIGAIVAGTLVVEDDGTPVYTTTDGKQIRFPEPDGASQMESDRVNGKYRFVAKTHAMLEGITGEPKGTFAKMKNRDLKVCEAIAVLFLA